MCCLVSSIHSFVHSICHLAIIMWDARIIIMQIIAMLSTKCFWDLGFKILMMRFVVRVRWVTILFTYATKLDHSLFNLTNVWGNNNLLWMIFKSISTSTLYFGPWTSGLGGGEEQLDLEWKWRHKASETTLSGHGYWPIYW